MAEEKIVIEHPIESIIEIDNDETVVVTEELVSIVDIAEQGPQGIPGAQGPQGPQGPPGALGSDAYYVHDQAVPSASWTITHNLGKIPSVSIMDSAGTIVEGYIDHIDTDSLTIEFSAPFAGKAILN